MKVLELFSGTGSVRKIAEKKGHSVLSLDLKNADINCNILEWDYKKYDVGEFDYIHASPPCDTFSHCRKCYFGKPLKRHNPDWSIPYKDKIKFSKELLLLDQLEEGVPILMKTLEIIDYFKPKYFTIENPKSGDMKNYMDLPFNDITYCKYNFPYRKITRVWNNLENWNPKPICTSKSLCENIVKVDGHIHHQKSCATRRLKHYKNVSEYGGSTNKEERYRIPPDLIEEWVESMD